MELNALWVAILFPVTLAGSAYLLLRVWHALVDSPEEKWRKRYMKSLIRLYCSY